MRLPDLIIVDAAKSCTTTLYQYLCRHPQVYPGKNSSTQPKTGWVFESWLIPLGWI